MHKHTHSLYPSPPPIHTRASSRIHPHRLFTLDPLLFTGHLPGLGLWGNPGCIHPHRLFTPNPRAFTGHLPGPIYSHPTLSHSQAIFQGPSIHTRPSVIHRPSSRAHLFTPDPLAFTGHLPGSIDSHPTLSHSQAIFQGPSIHTRPSLIHRPSSRV